MWCTKIEKVPLAGFEPMTFKVALVSHTWSSKAVTVHTEWIASKGQQAV
jgi:hypothetical protein